MNLLRELRNELIHYKTETLSSSSFEPDKIHTFEKRLLNKFEQNLFYKYLCNPYFTEKFLGYGCARWALESVIQFADLFYKKMDITPYYEHIREDILIEGSNNINTTLLRDRYISNRSLITNNNDTTISVAPVEIKAKLIHIDDLNN